MCTEAHTLLGSTSPHPMSYMLLAICMMVTMVTRIAGLVLAIMYQYKMVAILYPARDITEKMYEDACEWLSVLGEEGLEVYQKNSIRYKQVDGEGTLMYSGRKWMVWEKDDLISMDTLHIQQGNLSYGYYCEDIRTIFSYYWLPLASWIILFILPPLLLSITVLIFTFRTHFFTILTSFPIFLLSSIFSHLSIGPVHCSIRTPTHLALSARISYINLLLTMAAVIILLYLISSSTTILPVIILGPLFLLSSLLTIIFLLIYSPSSSCCRCSSTHVSRKILVFETADPTKTAVKLEMLL